MIWLTKMLSLFPAVPPSLIQTLSSRPCFCLFSPPSLEVECCGTLWPSASWLCPGHRTARWPTSRSCRTLTRQGWVGTVARRSKFYDHIHICSVVLSSEFLGEIMYVYYQSLYPCSHPGRCRAEVCSGLTRGFFFLLVCRHMVCCRKEGPGGFVLNWQHRGPVYHPRWWRNDGDSKGQSHHPEVSSLPSL